MSARITKPFGDGNRWIEVAPPGADTPIAICPPGPDLTPGGKETGISLQTDDIDAEHLHHRVECIARYRGIGATSDVERQLGQAARAAATALAG